MDKSVDLIIPLYNAKNWISGLVDTLNGQQCRDFRVIFVDDGSQDGTCSALREALKHAQFPSLLLQQENRGPSAARNLGIAHARAKWIAFTDCDDQLKPEYLSYLLTAVTDQNVQMGFCHLESIPVGSKRVPAAAGVLEVQKMTAAETMRSHYTHWIAPVCLILDREWIVRNGILFDEQCRYCEDLMFITRCIAAAEQVVQIQNALYVYWTHEGSLLRSHDTAKYLNGIDGFRRLEADLLRVASDASGVFASMGAARFLLGILRRAAIQMPYSDFAQLAKSVDLKGRKGQISRLPGKQKIAGMLYLISPGLFHFVVRRLFKD